MMLHPQLSISLLQDYLGYMAPNAILVLTVCIGAYTAKHLALSRTEQHIASALHSIVRPAQIQLYAGRDPDPNMLWSRGIYSPCFGHDHHLMVNCSDPPFSAGDWEVDWRRLIRIRFDQFGVASICQSTYNSVALLAENDRSDPKLTGRKVLRFLLSALRMPAQL